MILVDTNIIIDLWKKIDLETARTFENNEIAICQVIKVELIHGAKGKRDKRKIESVLCDFTMLPIDDETWDLFGDLLLKLKKSGVTVPFQDALIAAVAVKYKCLLWTNDKHFERIAGVIAELELFNP